MSKKAKLKEYDLSPEMVNKIRVQLDDAVRVGAIDNDLADLLFSALLTWDETTQAFPATAETVIRRLEKRFKKNGWM